MDPAVFDAELAKLRSKLRTLTKSDEHLEAMEAFDRLRASAPSRVKNIVHGAANQPTDKDVQEQAYRLSRTLQEGGVEEQTFRRYADLQNGKHTPKIATLPWMPCANVSAALVECKEKGKLVCSACGLVLYCSKDCQGVHWKQHRSDCKNKLRAKDWQPTYAREHRTPDFMKQPSKEEWLERRAGIGEHLWGSVPAVDILNLSKNEGTSCKQDLSLAFVASGDIANLVKTVNSLPDDYSGNLTVLLNDWSPFIAGRNFLLLLLLGTIPDPDFAAELALHLWYSAFAPEYSQFKIARVLKDWTDTHGWVEGSQTLAGGKSMLHSHMGRKPLDLLEFMVSSGAGDPNRTSIYDISVAKNEFSKAMSPPFNLDDHERQLAGARPFHRLALDRYRKNGIVLPFGATQSWFNVPNRFLFAPDGKWIQDDTVSPLHAWNIDDVLDAKSHGARSDDLFGSLYFYLADELRTFSDRLRRFKISIHLFSLPPLDLAKSLAAGNFANASLPATFDRIDIGQSLDAPGAGTGAATVEAWGRKLSSTNPHAAIVGISQNWYQTAVGGRAAGEEAGNLVGGLVDAGRFRLRAGSDLEVDDMQHDPEMLSLPRYIEAVRDNSAPFRKWLKDEGVDEAAAKGGVRVKARNSIVPHRILAPVGGEPSAFPVFANDEEWYRWTKLTEVAFTERYVEFAKA